ncbi:probetacellulin isoform X1 [Nelusetta ayraudi]|uniref:probetacellulin isoform X1 n=1 Tax=Nelusetta ayraudi TaxID=303726 RepID=UPI003F704F0F
MAKVYRLYVGIATALALCKYPMADQVTDSPANATASVCPPHHNGDNCTDTDPWEGHFSECPKNLTGFCVHGVCRYLKEHWTAACRCDDGFEGHRCEFVVLPLPLTPGMRRAILTGLIVVLVVLIVAIVLICLSSHFKCRFCWWRRRRRREAPSNVTEKLSMMDTGAAQTSPTGESTETTHTNAV